MNKKKVLLVVLAMVLVCALSVMTTMALLAEKTSITNTFVASGGPGPFVDPVNGFSIKEHGLDVDDFGNYTLDMDGELTNGNTYDVVPGVTLPKDPFVQLKRTNTTPAYLFIEVVNEASTAFSFDIDDTQWKALGINGNNGGALYVHSTDKTNAVVLEDVDTTYNIIKNKAVKVDDGESAKELGLVDAEGNATNKTIKFYAYICQATVAKADGTNTSDPAEVFDICF